MGLFGSKKIFVSSTVRNMAGPAEERPDYLKSTIASKVLLDGKESMGRTITDAYLNGPGIRLRSFYRWATTPGNYDTIGLVTGTLLAQQSLPSTTVKTYIEGIVGYTVLIDVTEVGSADYHVWAEQWMLDNYPAEFDTAWTSEYFLDTGQITVTRASAATHTFTPTGYDAEERYMYITYAQDNGDGTYGPDKIHIYQMGSGNAALDAADNTVNQENEYDDYYPFIPIRLENQFLSSTYLSSAYEEARSATRRLLGSKKRFDKLVEQIEELESLPDIDHTYVVFGPSINAIDQAAKDYIWEFFSVLESATESAGYAGTTEFNNWITARTTQAAQRADYQDWEEQQLDPLAPRYGTPAPTQSGAPSTVGGSITIKSGGSLPGKLHFEISWEAITRQTGTGLAKPGAVKGEVWFGHVQTDTYAQMLVDGTTIDPLVIGQHDLIKQTSNNTWEAIKFVGLKHRNYIYKGKYVEITLAEALADAEESGFIIPLNNGIFKNMRLVDSTQLALVCTNVLFNSYVVKKTGLLGSLFFKILLTIVIQVVMNAIVPGSGVFASGATTAGSAATSTLLSQIISAVITVAITMAVMAVMKPTLTAIFGKKLGALLSVLASVLVANMASSLATTGTASVSINWGTMAFAEKLTLLLNVLGDAYAAIQQANISSLAEKQEDFMDAQNQKMKQLQELYAENIGYGRGAFDPMMLTESDRPVYESPDMFLKRTLLTGTDIAQLSMDMITNFASATTTTQLPLGDG